MSAAIYLTGCAVLLCVAIYMIFAECYDDGIIGKLAAGVMAFGAFAALWHGLADRLTARADDAAWIVGGVALFMVRHLARFWKYKEKSRAHF